MLIDKRLVGSYEKPKVEAAFGNYEKAENFYEKRVAIIMQEIISIIKGKVSAGKFHAFLGECFSKRTLQEITPQIQKMLEEEGYRITVFTNPHTKENEEVAISWDEKRSE